MFWLRAVYVGFGRYEPLGLKLSLAAGWLRAVYVDFSRYGSSGYRLASAAGWLRTVMDQRVTGTATVTCTATALMDFRVGMLGNDKVSEW